MVRTSTAGGQVVKMWRRGIGNLVPIPGTIADFTYWFPGEKEADQGTC